MPRLKSLSLLILLSVTSSGLFAQNDTGTLLGTVVDPTQAVVVNAKVTLREISTHAVVSTTTDKSGVFQFPSILVGSYSVEVAAPGFKTYQLNGISLASAEIRNLGKLRMELGGVAEQVRVTAQATPVQTSSTEVNQTVEQRNVDYGHLLQYVLVHPNTRYSFSAYLRTDAITTDSGPRFQIFDAYDPGKMLAATENAVGTSGWTERQLEFKTSADTRLLIIRVARLASEKFDNKIRGTAWIDKVCLIAEE